MLGPGLAGVDCHMKKAEHRKVPSPIFLSQVEMKIVPVCCNHFCPSTFYSLVSSVVQICCPQTFTLGSLLDTERDVASTPGYSGYVLGCFSYI